jgi:hypothetical protein
VQSSTAAVNLISSGGRWKMAIRCSAASARERYPQHALLNAEQRAPWIKVGGDLMAVNL